MAINECKASGRDNSFIEVISGNNGSVIVTCEDEDGDISSLTLPESEWRRLCRESCGEETGDGRKTHKTGDGFEVLLVGNRMDITSPNGGQISMAIKDWVYCYGQRSPDEPKQSGWQPGPPTEIGKMYVFEYACRRAQSHKRETRFAAGTLIRIKDGICYFCDKYPACYCTPDIPIEDILRHFRIPDPPAPKPVPEPPKWVRVKHSLCDRKGWAFADQQFDAFHPWYVRWDDGVIDRYEKDAVQVIKDA